MASPRYAIFSIMIGDNPTFPLVEKNFQHYANRVGADLIICKTPKHCRPFLNAESNYGVFGLERLEIRKLLHQYDRVLCLDADILIKPDAANIFLDYPNEDTLYWFNEGAIQNRQAPIEALLTALDKQNLEWAKKKDKPVYYNSGVMLFSKAHQRFFSLLKVDELQRCLGKVDMFEQSYFNYICQANGITCGDLAPTYNRMEMKGGHFRRLRAHFIHYAGSGFTGHHKKRYQLLEDDIYTFLSKTLALQNPPKSRGYYRLRRWLYKLGFFVNIPAINYF